MLATATLLAGSLFAAQDPSPSASYYVSHGYYGFGETVGGAGDVNHDSVPDFVLGDGGAGEFPAMFWIVSGRDGSTLQLFSLPKTMAWCRLVDGGQDADGDGVPDMLVESRDDDQQSATLLVFSGRTGSLLCTMTSKNPAPTFGAGAHFVGDYDQDGLADVGILQHTRTEPRGSLLIRSGRTGALVAEVPLRSESGAGWRGFLEVASGVGRSADRLALVTTTSLELHDLASPASNAPRTLIWQHVPSAHPFQWQLCRLGDLDGDGMSDLAVSFWDAVDVVSGRTGRLLFHMETKVKQDREMGFGQALARLGDVDGDGLEDLAVSETEAGPFSGSVHGYSGNDGHEIWETKTTADEALCHFGSEMAAIGDIDGDGVTDLVVGTCEIFSKEPGVASVISGKTGAELYRFGRASETALEVSRRFPLRMKPR